MFPSPHDLGSVLIFDAGIFIALLLIANLLSRDSLIGRILFGTCAATIIVIYTAWRWHETLPAFEWAAESLWPYIFFASELIAIFYSLLSIAILMRWIDRSAEADVFERTLTASHEWPAVDIFICTYNEPIDVIEKSIIPALAIDYPNFTVWVLDDTRRPWLKTYCESLGANYLTRPDNKGAKAGNLNNALRETRLVSNAPLILVLDADFAASRNILRRTVGLFGDSKTAVVQTPQFFYNADPIQHNLGAAHAWVDDQRIFFDVFQPAKDAWGCAFCVGTSFVVRRDLLEEIGGFPDDSICEDINLSYMFMRRGYETHWLNEKLSIGLSAEGLPEYITQRTRWCLGTIQVALLPEGPFRGSGYRFMHRLHYFHGVLNWLCKPFIVLMLIAPSLYWICGLPAFYADYLSFLRYGLPALLALWIYSGWISGQRTLPLFMEVTHTLPAPAISMTLLSAIIRPFGRPFKVTDKGGDRSLSTLRIKMAVTFGIISLLSGVSILSPLISPYAATEVSSLDLFNMFWAGMAMVLSFVSFLVCFELPREDNSFSMDEAAAVGFADATMRRCHLTALSMQTALVECETHYALKPEDLLLIGFVEVGTLKAYVVEYDGRSMKLSFQAAGQIRNNLIRKLFSIPRDHQIAERADFFEAFGALFKRSFRAS